MTVDELYTLIKYIINKNQNGDLTPTGFYTVINQAQRQYQSWLLGSFQTYTPGRPIAKVELGQNSVVRQRLSPVIYRVVLTIDGSGNSDYPADYIQTDSMYMNTGNKRIRNVQQNALDANINSVIDPVATNPIYLIEDTRFQFYPVTLVNSKLTYVGDAPDIIWASEPDANSRAIYTTGISSVPVLNGGSGYISATVTFSAPASGITATGVVVLSGGIVTGITITNHGTGYNNTTPTVTFAGVGGTGAVLGAAVVSVDPVWDNIAILDIIDRALKQVGVNLQSGAVIQYANELKGLGQ